MRKRSIERFWEGETVSIICKGREALEGTNTVGWNGDDADMVWVTRPYELEEDSFAVRVTTLNGHRDWITLRIGCKCQEYNLANPRLIHCHAFPEQACVELAIKAGASTIFMIDPPDAVVEMAKKAGITLQVEEIEKSPEQPKSE